jgi:hypothetical protein
MFKINGIEIDVEEKNINVDKFSLPRGSNVYKKIIDIKVEDLPIFDNRAFLKLEYKDINSYFYISNAERVEGMLVVKFLER